VSLSLAVLETSKREGGKRVYRIDANAQRANGVITVALIEGKTESDVIPTKAKDQKIRR